MEAIILALKKKREEEDEEAHKKTDIGFEIGTQHADDLIAECEDIDVLIVATAAVTCKAMAHVALNHPNPLEFIREFTRTLSSGISLAMAAELHPQKTEETEEEKPS